MVVSIPWKCEYRKVWAGSTDFFSALVAVNEWKARYMLEMDFKYMYYCLL